MAITFDFSIKTYEGSSIPIFVCSNNHLKNLYPSSSQYYGGLYSNYLLDNVKLIQCAVYYDADIISADTHILIQSIPVTINGVTNYLKFYASKSAYSYALSVNVYFSSDPTSRSGYVGGQSAPVSKRYLQVRNMAQYLQNTEGEITWQAIGSAFAWCDEQAVLPYNYNVNDMYCFGMRTQNWSNFDADADEISKEVGEPSTEGGYTGGTFDDSSDTIAIPTAPALGVTSAGFINVYSPSANELAQFGSELFPNLSFTPVSQGGTPSSVTDALVSMAQVLVDFGNQIPALIDMYINANLIQYVIDCHLIPVAPTKTGTSPLKVGFKTFSQTPAKVTSDYVDFDCGTLNVGEYYENFADYSPYTSAKLYLPFVGFMDIAPEYWQSGTLQVVYRFNVIDGSFVAYVKSTSSKSKLSDTVIAQFGGNACVHIPITGLNYASMVSGIVSAVSPLLPSAKANVGTVDKLVNSANTIASAKPTMQQSNGYNATTSFLTVRFPYLLIERSVSNFSKKYADENGIPSNITIDFATLSGFTKATMLHLDGIAGATEDDLDEIAQLLSEGVIL